VSDRQALPQRWLYGRRRGRALRPGQRRLKETLLPRLAFTVQEAVPLDPHRLFAQPVEALWLELGFGAGEHLAALAAAHRAIGFIGAEVFENGVVKLLALIERERLDNIRLFIDDGRRLIAALPPACLARAFILFPDPWPKERHKKRRLVARETLDELARVMLTGAELRLATDDEDYAQAMHECVAGHPCFSGTEEARERPSAWPATRYEQKALAAGRKPLYLRTFRSART
jgi:tRNA (guanine-N7-)-methyltransferase